MAEDTAARFSTKARSKLKSEDALSSFALCAFLVSAGLMAAQTSIPRAAQGNVSTQSQLGPFLDQLGGLRIEYKADLGLSVLESNWKRVPSKKKLATLTDIFDSAWSARFEANGKYASDRPGDSNASQTATTLEAERLDSLDIQTRVARLFLRDTPDLAGDFFGRIVIPTKRSSCSDPLVEDLTSYYDTLALLINDSRIRTIAGQQKGLFLIGVVQAARDPEEIVPLLRMLRQAELDGDSLQTLVAYVTQNLEAAVATDREMKALSGSMSTGMFELVSTLRGLKVPEAKLLAGYRTFLTESLSREYCTDVSTNRAEAAAAFNRLLVAGAAQYPRAIEEGELKPRVAAGAATDPRIPLNEALIPVLQRVINANHARMLEIYDSGGPGTIEPENADVQELLRFAVTPIRGEGTCPPCDFQAQAQVFLILQSAIPARQNLETMVADEVAFLSFNRIEDEDPPAFLNTLKWLIRIARPVSGEARKTLSTQAKAAVFVGPGTPSDEPDYIRKQLRSSPDPAIRAYATYEDIFRPAYAPIS